MDWISEKGEFFKNCAVFFRVNEQFGGLSNMAGGYPLTVNGIKIHSSEALYQACRFPHETEWQREIIAQTSPMAAKMKSKKDGRRKDYSRPDWNEIEVEVMEWVLRVKLAQHYKRMSWLLISTGDRTIVEKSRKDRFWGAVENEFGLLTGRNQLGKLLMDMREFVNLFTEEELLTVETPNIPNFKLLGDPIGIIEFKN